MTSNIVTRVKSILAVALLVALCLIGQTFSLTVYTVGIVMILCLVVIGFTFNNVAEDRPARKLAVPLAVTWAIVAGIFALSYVLAPVLARIGS